MYEQKNRRVLFVTATSILAENGTVSRLHTAIRALRELGCDSMELVGFESPRLLSDRRAVGERISWFMREGVKATFLPTIPQRIPWGRRLNSAWARSCIKRFIKGKDYTVISALNSDAASACAGVNTDAKVIRVFDLHGVESEEEVLAGSARRGSRRFRDRIWCESRGLNWAEVVVSPSPCTQAWGKALVGEIKTDWFSLPTLNRVELDESWLLGQRSRVRQELGWTSNSVVLYAGGLSAWQQPELMTRVIEKAIEKNDTVRFLMLTPNVEAGNAVLASCGIADYAVAKSVPRDEVPAYGAAADAALLLRGNSVVNQVASPTKFAEYLEMGVPVLVTEVLAEFCATVERHAVGTICKNDSTPSDYAERLLELLSQSMANREELLRQCRHANRRDYRFERALDVYKQILALHEDETIEC